MNKLDITEEQKQAYLNDCDEVDKKHGLQHFAMLHPSLQKIEAVLGIRKKLEPTNHEPAR